MKIITRMLNKTVQPVFASQAVAGSVSARGESRSIWSRRLALFIACEEGSTLVETLVVTFCLIVPLLIGIFSLTMATISYQKLGFVTLNTTQTLGTGRNILTDPCATAASSVTSGLPNWPNANFTYTLTITSTVDNVNTTTTYGPYTGTAAATCTAAATTLSEAQNNQLTLQVVYAYTWFPIFGKRIAGKLADNETVLVS